jgi:hypothetical protein
MRAKYHRNVKKLNNENLDKKYVFKVTSGIVENILSYSQQIYTHHK